MKPVSRRTRWYRYFVISLRVYSRRKRGNRQTDGQTDTLTKYRNPRCATNLGELRMRETAHARFVCVYSQSAASI